MSMMKGVGGTSGGILMQGAAVGLAVSDKAVQSRSAAGPGGHGAPAHGAARREPDRSRPDGADRGAESTSATQGHSNHLQGTGMTKNPRDVGQGRDAAAQAVSAGEHRAAGRRMSYDIQVGIATRHRLFVGLAANISSGGLFVATDETLARGDRVEVRFRIPGSDHVFHKQAEVAWTRPLDESQSDATQQSGAGVRLLDLTDDEKRTLNAFIEVHDPIFFDV